MTFEEEIRRLAVDIKNLKLKYKNLKHQDRDQICESMYRAKFEAYRYIETKLIDIFKWFGKEI